MFTPQKCEIMDHRLKKVGIDSSDYCVVVVVVVVVAAAAAINSRM